MHGVCHASQGGDPPEQSTFQPLRLGPTLKIPVIVEGIEVEALVDMSQDQGLNLCPRQGPLKSLDPGLPGYDPDILLDGDVIDPGEM